MSEGKKALPLVDRTRVLPPYFDTVCGDCGVPVRMGQDAIAWWAACNNALDHRGEKPITRHEVAKCNDCYLAWSATQTHAALAELAAREPAKAEGNHRRTNPNEEVLND